MNVGDEVVTHALVPGSPHRCLDACYEVRELESDDDFLVLVNDTFLRQRWVDREFVTLAPTGLLVRKNAFYRRMKYIADHARGADLNASGHVLDQLGRELDAYLFADHASARMWPGIPGPKAERQALDAAARFLIEHRRDHGLGRPRHKILADVTAALELA